MPWASVRLQPRPVHHHCPCTGSARHPALFYAGNADRAPVRGGGVRSCHPCATGYWARHDAKSPARKGARTARHPFGTIMTTSSCAIWNEAQTRCGHDEKIWSGRIPKSCRTALERCDDTSYGRSWTAPTATEPTHCDWLGAFRRAGNRPHRPRTLALGGGHPRGLAGLPALKRLSQSIVTVCRERKPSGAPRRKSTPPPPPTTHRRPRPVAPEMSRFRA